MATLFQGCKRFVVIFVTVALTVVLLWLNMDKPIDAGSHTPRPIQYTVQHMLLERSQVSYLLLAIASLFLNDPVGTYYILIVRFLL